MAHHTRFLQILVVHATINVLQVSVFFILQTFMSGNNFFILPPVCGFLFNCFSFKFSRDEILLIIMIHSVCHASSTKCSWYDCCNYNLWSRRVVTESLSTAWSLSGNFHCGWAFPSPQPCSFYIILYLSQKTKRQQNSKLAGPPPAHNPTPGHFSRSCPSPLLLLHLLLILQANFTAPSFEHSYFYFCFLVDLWLPKLIFRQFETCSLL